MAVNAAMGQVRTVPFGVPLWKKKDGGSSASNRKASRGKEMSARDKRLAARRARRRSNTKPVESIAKASDNSPRVPAAVPERSVVVNTPRGSRKAHSALRQKIREKTTVDERFREMYRAFMAFDADRSGKIRPAELGECAASTVSR